MRGGALPPALLAASLGFALAFAPRKAITPSLAAFAGVAVVASLVKTNPAWTDGIFYACWGAVMVTALSVHLTKGLNQGWAVALAVNAGLWAGLVVAAAGAASDLAKAAPWALLCLPGAWLVKRKLGIGIKVVASWLVAVAFLAAMIPTTTPTPGYVGDHLE